MSDVFHPHHQPPPLPGLADGEDPISHLRRCLDHATAHADQLAASGGHEREEADRRMAQARRFFDAAATARRRVDWWNHLIAVAEAEQAKDRPPAAQARPLPAAPQAPQEAPPQPAQTS